MKKIVLFFRRVRFVGLPVGCLYLLSVSVAGRAQTSCTLDAGPDAEACGGATVHLSATPGFDSYVWTPATGLDNPGIANPTATVTGDITYRVTAVRANTGTETEWLSNGDFSQGNTGFTTQYDNDGLYSPCHCTVTNTFFGTSIPIYDHSPGAGGNFLSVDGCVETRVLWEQTLPLIDPHSDYDFSFWATRAGVSAPVFEIHYIGNVTGEVNIGSFNGILALTDAVIWDRYVLPSWNSGNNTSVTIRLITPQANGYGVDYAMDDFSFVSKNCVRSDEVTLRVLTVPPPLMPADEKLCRDVTPPALQATGENIRWYNAPGGTGTPTAPVPFTGVPGMREYFASQTVNGCESGLASVRVEVIGPPSLELGTAPEQSTCIGETYKLGVEEVPGWQYMWSDSVKGSLRVVSSENTGTQTYILTVSAECGSRSDSVSLRWDECRCQVYWPGAFTPDGDMNNPVFKPAYDCRIREFVLRVFNRWGETVFESHHPDEGWNGERNGKPAEEGLYMWQVNYVALSGTKKIYESTTDRVILVR